MKVLYPPELKAEAKKLRLEGYSYTQIRRTLGLKSKGTLSLWLKDLELTAEAEQKLKSNQHLSEARGLKDSNRARSLRIREENHEQYLLGFESMKHFGARSLEVIGASLYWGEGTKSLEPEGKNNQISFANSDRNMISIFVTFLEESLGGQAVLVISFGNQRIKVLYNQTDKQE